jgi:hypothetical protein
MRPAALQRGACGILPVAAFAGPKPQRHRARDRPLAVRRAVGKGLTLNHCVSLNYAVLSPATTEETTEMPQLRLKLSDKVFSDCEPLAVGRRRGWIPGRTVGGNFRVGKRGRGGDVIGGDGGALQVEPR